MLGSAFESSLEALQQPTISVVAVIAEGVPEADTKRLIAYARAHNKVLLGPATVGGIQVFPRLFWGFTTLMVSQPSRSLQAICQSGCQRAHLHDKAMSHELRAGLSASICPAQGLSNDLCIPPHASLHFGFGMTFHACVPCRLEHSA